MSSRCLFLLASCVSLLGQRLLAQGQMATLVVIASDAVRGEPLSFADVSIESPRRERLADERGIVRFTGLTPGTVSVRVRRVGFVPLRRSIAIAGNDTLRVALQHLAFTLPPAVSRDAVCPGTPVGDTATLAIIEQMRINADRARMLTEQFVFSMRVERVLSSDASFQKTTDTLQIAGAMTWRYAPGKLVVRSTDPRDHSAELLLLPQLAHLGSDEFIQFHCFRYVGRKELDGVERIRIDFEPIRTLKETDFTGSIYLDTLSFRLVAMTLEMDRPINQSTDRTIKVDSRYIDLLPGIPIAQQTCARTTVTATSAVSSRKQYALEWQRLLGINFVSDSPVLPGSVVTGTQCRR